MLAPCKNIGPVLRPELRNLDPNLNSDLSHFELIIGTPVTPAPWNVRTNFSFYTPFRVTSSYGTHRRARPAMLPSRVGESSCYRNALHLRRSSLFKVNTLLCLLSALRQQLATNKFNLTLYGYGSGTKNVCRMFTL